MNGSEEDELKPLYIRRVEFARYGEENGLDVPFVTENELALLDEISHRPPATFKYIVRNYFSGKGRIDFERVEQLLLFYYNREPIDRLRAVGLKDPEEFLEIDLFAESDYKERTNQALSLLYELWDELPGSKRNLSESLDLLDYMTADGKKLYPYIREKLVNLPQVGHVKVYAEVHTVLVKNGYLQTDLLPKTKGQPRGVVLVKLYKDAFGFLGDRSTFMSHIKSFQDMDPLSENCQLLAAELKNELRRIIVANSGSQV